MSTVKVIDCRNPKEWEIDYDKPPVSRKGSNGLYHMTWGENDVEAKLDKLFKDAAKAYRENKVEGLMVKIGYADGNAFYRVVKAKPLTLEHIPYGDAWALPLHQLRGLTLKDIMEMNEPT